jgi:hypothetical protein
MSTKHGDANTAAESRPALNPGDEAAPGTPGSGEDICPQCNGKGRLNSGKCPNCGGRGRIIRAVGGA